MCAILTEPKRLTMRDVERICRVNDRTVRTWYLRGVRGRVLRTYLIGGRRYTTQADLERFVR